MIAPPKISFQGSLDPNCQSWMFLDSTHYILHALPWVCDAQKIISWSLPMLKTNNNVNCSNRTLSWVTIKQFSCLCLSSHLELGTNKLGFMSCPDPMVAISQGVPIHLPPINTVQPHPCSCHNTAHPAASTLTCKYCCCEQPRLW